MSEDIYPPKLKTKPLLIGALRSAARLEQQFMCQYLYAAFSLKKGESEDCQAHELEVVRRWASVLYMIARQEMEHLSIVNSLLTAIGGLPCYTHLNFPTTLARRTRAPLRAEPAVLDAAASGAAPPAPFEAALAPELLHANLQERGDRSEAPFGETFALKLPGASAEPSELCPMPFVLEPFSLNALRRFACMEAPQYPHVPEAEKPEMADWCFRDAQGECKCVQPRSVPTPPAPKSLFQADRVVLGSIEELYDEVRKGLRYLVERDGEAEVFSGHPSGQSEIPSEYMITLFPIFDLESALSGIDLITVQGEGIDAPPSYESHFMRFVKMAEEYVALSERAKAEERCFEPARRLPDNPKPEDFDPGSVVRQAVELFRQGYVTLLYMLTGYYQFYSPSKWSQYPYLTQALEQTSFAPMMTMFVRSLAEVIVELPAGEGRVAGPSFELNKKDLELLEDPGNACFGQLKFYLDELERLCLGVKALQGALETQLELHRKLTFMLQTMTRVRKNLVEITEQGTFPQFDSKSA